MIVVTWTIEPVTLAGRSRRSLERFLNSVSTNLQISKIGVVIVSEHFSLDSRYTNQSIWQAGLRPLLDINIVRSF